VHWITGATVPGAIGSVPPAGFSKGYVD
jgi:hypothetical protein